MIEIGKNLYQLLLMALIIAGMLLGTYFGINGDTTYAIVSMVVGGGGGIAGLFTEKIVK